MGRSPRTFLSPLSSGVFNPATAHFSSAAIRLERQRDGRSRHIEIVILPHASIPAKCSRCLQPAPGYDQLPPRTWLFMLLWGMVTWFVYAARGGKCPEHGVVVEHVPWSDGKRPVTFAMMGFLSRWARRLELPAPHHPSPPALETGNLAEPKKSPERRLRPGLY